MKEKIIQHLDHPEEIEKLYRANKSSFKKSFSAIEADYSNHIVVQCWKARLENRKNEINWGSLNNFIWLLVLCTFTSILAKLPSIFSISEETYYSRNIGFILFPSLCIYFSSVQRLSVKKNTFIFIFIVSAVIFINLLPDARKSDTLILSCIHFPLLLWSLLGFSFTGNELFSVDKRMSFLRYNGDLLVLSAIILIAGGILTGITIGLFSLINMDISEFYFKYVVVAGLSSCPLLASYIIQHNPGLVNRISPIIAKIFTPLVLVTLVFYLFAIFTAGKNPYTDREFLLTFNLLLIGVMALIFFSLTEIKSGNGKGYMILLFLLSLTTILVNLIALSAILFRISEWGFSPNRITVLGGNVLILINLILVAFRLVKVVFYRYPYQSVNEATTQFLPLYTVWSFVVSFIFPFLFSFR